MGSGGVRGSGWGGGGQGGCERRIEVFVKIQKQKLGGGRGRVGRGVRVDVIEELKFLGKFKKKIGGGGGGVGVGRGQVGVGLAGGGGQGGCEQRIEVFVKIQKKNIFFFFGGGGGGAGGLGRVFFLGGG